MVPGHRVRVPFRGRPRLAVVVRVDAGPEDGLEPVTAVLDAVPALTPALLELARRTAEETVSAWGEVVFRALPPGVRARAPEALPAPRGLPARPAALVTGRTRNVRIEHAVSDALAAGEGVLLLAPEIEQARLWAARLEARTRRAGPPRDERGLARGAVGGLVGLPSGPGPRRGRHPGGGVAPADAARARGPRRRGGSGAQGARRAALACAGPRPRAGTPRRRREPSREPRAEPRELGGGSSGDARHRAGTARPVAGGRARGAGRRLPRGREPLAGTPRRGPGGARPRGLGAAGPEPSRLRPDPRLRRLRGGAALRAVPAGAPLPARGARA